MAGVKNRIGIPRFCILAATDNPEKIDVLPEGCMSFPAIGPDPVFDMHPVPGATISFVFGDSVSW